VPEDDEWSEARAARYSAAAEQARHEGDMLWTVYQSFLLAHTFFMGFLLTVATSRLGQQRLAVIFSAALGLLACAFWYGSYVRCSTFYLYRMAVARECEPEDWRQLRDRGEQLSDGKVVYVSNGEVEQPFQMPRRAMWLRRKRAAPGLIALFVVGYAAFAIAAALAG
jgi:hypothetical protein